MSVERSASVAAFWQWWYFGGNATSLSPFWIGVLVMMMVMAVAVVEAARVPCDVGGRQRGTPFLAPNHDDLFRRLFPAREIYPSQAQGQQPKQPWIAF